MKKPWFSNPSNGFRARRLRSFLALVDGVLAHKPICRVLDVGGEKAYWQGLERVWRGRNLDLTLVNLRQPEASEGRYTCMHGDARDMAQFADGSFDIVHSNSVIEHVGGWPEMRRMAAETRRLAPKYFVQTPNFWFPFEPHYRVPMLHWLPRPWQISIVRARACGFYPRATNIDQAYDILADVHLLNAASLQALFPDARLSRERIGPFVKSLTAIRHRLGGPAPAL